MINKEMKKFVEWCENTHPEFIEKFVKDSVAELNLDTTDTSLWNLHWNKDQKKIINAIWNRINADAHKVSYFRWTNWENIPYIGKEIIEAIEDGRYPFERYQDISLDSLLDEAFPIIDENEFLDGFFKDYPELKEKYENMTVGQINEILLFLCNEADTSAKYDW